MTCRSRGLRRYTGFRSLTGPLFEALGPEHKETLVSMANLAMLLKMRGKLEEAEVRSSGLGLVLSISGLFCSGFAVIHPGFGLREADSCMIMQPPRVRHR